MGKPLTVLVVGCGHMGSAHAAAYHEMEGFDIVGLVSRGLSTRKALNKQLGGKYRLFSKFDKALNTSQPDVVSINTYPDTHEAYAIQAFSAGCHVFLEKPIAPTIRASQNVIQASKDAGKKLVIGYILRQHPSWTKFTEIAKTLGKPLVMRMNLNRQSSGERWETHKKLMDSTSPIVDCGVHYVDVMCQMTGANPIRVFAIGARLTNELPEGMYNWGQLQVAFDDGSMGWFESGWGPMISETAPLVRDVFGPKGSVSLDVQAEPAFIKQHHGVLDGKSRFVRKDRVINLEDEPNHQALCRLEQEYLLRAIREDLDLTGHLSDAMNSLRIVLAADESIYTGDIVEIQSE